MAVSAETSRSPRMISVMRFAGTPSDFASARALIPSGTRYSSRNTSPGWVRRRAISSSMIVHNLYICRSVGRPSEANPPLTIDADTPLPFPIAFQSFETVTRWRPKIVQPGRCFDYVQLSHGRRFEPAPCRRTNVVGKQPFRSPVRKAPDHDLLCVMHRITVKIGLTLPRSPAALPQYVPPAPAERGRRPCALR